VLSEAWRKLGPRYPRKAPRPAAAADTALGGVTPKSLGSSLSGSAQSFHLSLEFLVIVDLRSQLRGERGGKEGRGKRKEGKRKEERGGKEGRPDLRDLLASRIGKTKQISSVSEIEFCTLYVVANRWILGCILPFMHAKNYFSDTLLACAVLMRHTR
jgi:hypothetical protein